MAGARTTQQGAQLAAAIRPASTLILLRDAAPGLEVFMLRRAERASFLGGAHVFPGGALDAGDSDARILSRIIGLTAAAANARLALHAGAPAYLVAAVRECLEEARIPVALRAGGGGVTTARLALAV